MRESGVDDFELQQVQHPPFTARTFKMTLGDFRQSLTTTEPPAAQKPLFMVTRAILPTTSK
jgi:hypothetical protein